MKTLYETLMTVPLSDLKGNKELERMFEDLDNAEIILINNVAEYYFEQMLGRHISPMIDFPNLAPPFETFYMEFRAPIGGEIIQCGALLRAQKVEGRVVLFFGDKPDENTQPEWMVSIVGFFRVKNNLVLPVVEHILSVKSDGTILVPANYNESHIPSRVIDGADKKLVELYRGVAVDFIPPLFLAISMMHCKNVELIQRNPHKSGKRNRHGPHIVHHVLEIEPMKRVLKYEGESEKTGLKFAIHICRGHFKDFSKGKGLFGRYKGMYWWDSQVRGSISQGIVNKDYSINPPDDDV